MRANAAKRCGLRSAIFCSFLTMTHSQSPAAESVPFRTGNSEIQFFGGHPRKIVIHTISPAQDDIKILGRAYTDAQCHVNAPTFYDIFKPPLHGLICFRDEKSITKIVPYNEDSTINTHPYDKGTCLGESIIYRVVYYMLIGTYVGPDSFKYALVDANHNPQSIADVSITITPPHSPRRQSQVDNSTDTPTETRQEPGPMPRCPEPIT